MKSQGWLLLVSLMLMYNTIGCGEEPEPVIQEPKTAVEQPDPVVSKPNVTEETGSSPEIVNSIGMKLVLIRAGEFLMGSSDGEEGHDHVEQQHRVRITKPFYLQTTEVTQGQWYAVTGTKPWSGKPSAVEGPEVAATYVSWEDAAEFCRKLGEKESVTYRLPTEAEWEYACRAGTMTAYCFGDDASLLGEYAWFEKNAHKTGESYAHQVGLKKANAFGLYDMHGNVWEWCQDWYGDYDTRDSARNDPAGPSSSSFRVFRGGCWGSMAGRCRAAFRFWVQPERRIHYLGFRVAAVCQATKPGQERSR
jgi:formylglycine-generating enzyme required for sulfatase activity